MTIPIYLGAPYFRFRDKVCKMKMKWTDTHTYMYMYIHYRSIEHAHVYTCICKVVVAALMYMSIHIHVPPLCSDCSESLTPFLDCFFNAAAAFLCLSIYIHSSARKRRERRREEMRER